MVVNELTQMSGYIRVHYKNIQKKKRKIKLMTVTYYDYDVLKTFYVLQSQEKGKVNDKNNV